MKSKTHHPTDIYLALNSGTSMDGVDACLFQLSDERIELIAHHHQAYNEDLKTQLRQSIHQPITWLKAAKLDQFVAVAFIKTAKELLKHSGFDKPKAKKLIRVCASHGQTIFHAPMEQISIQLGNPSMIAQALALDVIADFRSADLSAKGQGAPLAPLFHEFLFQQEISQLKPNQSLAVVNLGGIGNITLLKSKLNSNPITVGYDFGPANTLLDWVCQTELQEECDFNGNVAKTGDLLTELLRVLTSDPYFKQAYPKSTGVEYFSGEWLKGKIKQTDSTKIKTSDLLHTLCVFVAHILSLQIDETCQSVYLSGGGSHNQFLVEQIKKELKNQGKSARVKFISDKLRSEAVECGIFAYLAKSHLDRKRIEMKYITGAKSTRILGVHYPY